jgi:two-component system sensor histidine kinase/response regulator
MPTHATANELRAENATLRQRCVALESRMAEMESRLGAPDRFSQLFHANPDAIFITEIDDGRVLDVNEAAIQLTGSSHAEMIGRTTLELGFFPNRATRTARVQQVLGGDRSSEYELTFIRRDGAVIYANTTSQVMEIGGAPRLVTIARDVTAARELERVLRASEERYRLLAENISDVIWMLDLRTNRFTYISPSVEKLYGYTVEEAMQFTFIDLLTAEALHTVTMAMAEVAQSVRTDTPIDRRRMELEQIRKDGSTVCTEIMVSGMFNQDDGELIGALGVTRDITERRTQEAAIREANATLEQRVAERTQQLQTANLALEKAALAKDEFLATMSHELRTPLVGVLNMAEALQTGVYGMPSEGMMRGLKTIERSGHQLLKLINDMLDLSRIELGRLELREDFFAVGDVVRASLQTVAETAAKQNVTLEVTAPPTAIWMIADHRRVQQMLVNLLSNAVKFTPAGGTVGLSIVADIVSKTVHFTVWDTGIGIDAGMMQRVFEPFTQTDSQLARHYGGAGMGLALVKKMAELHGGSVSAESEPGVGSRFSVTLPWRQPVHFTPPTETTA